MSRSRILPILLLLAIPITACLDSGKLTTSKAQGALNRWVKNGSVTVTGIQEIPQENSAKADLVFTDFQLVTRGLFGKRERKYSGPGVAIFTHYNDGRWVLTKVSTSQGLDSVWWNDVNIEAN